MNQHLAVIERALQQHKGDDLARARAAFGRCTPEQMQEQWGSSGRTRADVPALVPGILARGWAGWERKPEILRQVRAALLRENIDPAAAGGLEG